MPNTGERREITKRVNAKQAETVQQSRKLLSKTRQLFASTQVKNVGRIAEATKGRSREHGSADKRRTSSGFGSQHSVPRAGADEEASARMNDEGCPNENPSRNNANGEANLVSCKEVS